MESSRDLRPYDVVFIGHVCRDEIQPFHGDRVVLPGSAVLCGAAVAGRLGVRTAVITRMHPSDESIVRPLKDLGVDVYARDCAVTAYARVVHPSENVDERKLYVTEDPGPFVPGDVPENLRARMVHLAGISNHEFTMAFIEALKARGFRLSLDLQSFVRVVGPDREILFSDVPGKRRVVSLLDVAKLDVVEAEILTGTRDLGRAASIVAEWGAKEVLITAKAGLTLAADGRILHVPFTNRTQVGRTGRGDTTISAYLCRCKDHPPEEAAAFAAAVVSIKMEALGPFVGTLADVERRRAESS